MIRRCFDMTFYATLRQTTLIPYSHSILSMHRNALIYERKIFLLTV
jgi:hypothetical protein